MNFLNTLPFVDLVQRVATGSEPHIVAAGEGLLLDGVKALLARVQDGSVVIAGVRHAVVSQDAPDVLADIAAVRPWTISWSNVLDYVPDFHALARAVSVEDTIHFGYSMNWRSRVKGTCLLDYGPVEVRRSLLAATRKAVTAMHGDASRKLWGVTLFAQPLPCNPINAADYLLGVKFHAAWAERFFRTGGVPATQVGNQEYCLYNPLDHSHGLLFMTWSYDPTVSFTPHEGTYTSPPPGLDWRSFVPDSE